MEQTHKKSSTVTDLAGVTHKVTYVQRHVAVIDEKGLRKALTARIFDKYTVKKLDKKRLEAALDTGEVDHLVVARFVSDKPSAPYLNYTENTELQETS